MRTLVLVCALCSPLASRTLLSQVPGKPFLGIHTGLGLSIGDSIYASTVIFSGRLAGGIQFGRLGLEASAQYGTGWKDSDILLPRAPFAFELYGAGLAVLLDTRVALRQVRLRLGAGAYRVSASDDVVSGQTALGLEGGVETTLSRWSRGALSLGIRGLVLPDVHGELVWFVPLEVGIRLW